jgi:HK97 family phage portal protein
VALRDLFRWTGRKSVNSTLDLIRELYGAGRMSSAGKTVNLENALRVATAFACGRVIANGVAQVPIKLMREAGGKRLPARDHPLYDLLALRPNPWQTSFEFRTTMSFHVEFCGNFFAFKNAPLGEIRELIPLLPGNMEVYQEEDMTLRYKYRHPKTGAVREIPAEDIWHVRGPSWNGWMGMEWLSIARDALGLAMAAEESMASLHKNGVQASGGWSVKPKLNAEQYKALVGWLKTAHGGSGNAGAPLILDNDAKWVSTVMSSREAEHVETRKLQIEEVCRAMGVMPIMVGYSDKATTYASSEQMFLAHVVHTLSPRWTLYEQSMDANLLTDKERAGGLYFDFVEEGMIRGAVKDTKDAIVGYVNGGIMTPNEGRAKLDLNPDVDPDSDKLRIPVNVAQEPEKPAEDPNAKAIEDLRLEVKALRDRPAPAPVINVDATTTVQEGAVKVAPAAVTVDARTSIEPGAVRLDAPVSVSNTVEPAAPVIKAYPSSTEEIIERGADGEIKSVVRRAKD